MAEALPGVSISAAAAYKARIFYGVTVPLVLLMLAAAGMRIRKKLYSGLTWDDGLIILGVALAIADWGLLIPTMIPVSGDIDYLTATNAVKLGYFAIHVWVWSMTAIKISVALMLLRIKNTLRWRIFLYPIMGVVLAYCIGNTIFLFNACRPLAGWWDHSIPDTVCLPDYTVIIAANVSAVVNITTDFLLALSPIVFLRKLNRPLGERIMLSALMALGLLASLMCLIKTVTNQVYNSTLDNDIWATVVTVCTWTVLEALLAGTAACSPFLKQPFERVLRFVGIRVSPGDESESRFRGGFRSTFRIHTITATHPERTGGDRGNNGDDESRGGSGSNSHKSGSIKDDETSVEL